MRCCRSIPRWCSGPHITHCASVRYSTSAVAQSLRSAYSDIPEVVERDIAEREWSAGERAELATAIRDVMRFDQPEGERLQKLRELHDSLLGASLEERLDILYRTRLWDLELRDSDAGRIPALAEELGSAVADGGPGALSAALAIGRELEDQGTRYAVLRSVAQRLGPSQVGRVGLDGSDWTAVAAAISAGNESGDTAWVDTVLTEVAAKEPAHLPELLRYVELTSARVGIALDLVESGLASATDLSPLLFGARIRDLDDVDAARLLRALGNAGAVDASLGMLSQLADVRPELTPELKDLASQLAFRALGSRAATMVEYDIERLVTSGVFDRDALLRILALRLRHGPSGRDQLDQVVAERLMAEAEAAAPEILAIIRRLGYRAVVGADEIAILSRLASAISPEFVWTQLSRWSEDDLRLALHHMTWDGTEPEPLVRAFLTSDRLSGLEADAAGAFTNSLGVVVGPYYIAVEREVQRAESWRKALDGTPGAAWADALVEQQRASVEWHRQRDAEDHVKW
jgi:hypothetical protein